MDKNQRIINTLSSELNEFLSEFGNKEISDLDILSMFRIFMTSAKVDSDITVAVLEQFGKLGADEARIIKVDEGW